MKIKDKKQIVTELVNNEEFIEQCGKHLELKENTAIIRFGACELFFFDGRFDGTGVNFQKNKKLKSS